MVEIVILLGALVFAYCAVRISRRFGRSGALGLLFIIPLGSVIFWAIMARTEIELQNEGTQNVK